MTVAVYLAARYQERDRIEELAGKLRQDGIEVASHWHWGPEYTDLAEAAQRDRADIERADALVLFTQEPEAGDWPTGGRHVEFGMALALGKKTIVAGPAENIFCLLPEVIWLESQDATDIAAALKSEQGACKTIQQ